MRDRGHLTGIRKIVFRPKQENLSQNSVQTMNLMAGGKSLKSLKAEEKRGCASEMPSIISVAPALASASLSSSRSSSSFAIA